MVEKLDAALADFEHHPTRMAHPLAGGPLETPANGLDLLSPPFLLQNPTLEPLAQVVSQHAQTEEHGVGFELTTGHALHAEASLEFLDAVLAGRAAPRVPFQGVGAGGVGP